MTTPPPTASTTAEQPAKAEKPKEKPKAAPKKRKRSPAATSRKKKEPAAPKLLPPPKQILLVDNGGDALKYGLVSKHERPEHLPNVTSKLQHQWTVLVGDEIHTVQATQLGKLVRSMERGCVTNLGNQVQVWKRMLDLLRIQVSMASEAAQAFGWKVARQTNKQQPLYTPQTMAVLLLVPPFLPRTMVEQIMYVWFHDFGFSHVGLATSALFGADLSSPTGCSCVVDMGWGSTHVVPTVEGTTTAETSASIRRIGLGGRHMVNLWKYYCSYRQWNLMDAEYLLRDAHHQLAFVSTDFDADMDQASRLVAGKRTYDREFVLPDYQTAFQGVVRLPPALRQAEQALDQSSAMETETPENEGNGDQKDEDNDDDDDDDDDEQGDSDEEESEEQMRRRILRQREAEERRRREEELERQVLHVSVERFTIPEILFRPTDAGLDRGMAGLPQAVVSSILSCPKKYHAAMFGSIRIIGGVSKLPGLQERLERELRSLAPTQYKVSVSFSDNPIDQVWKGAKQWVESTLYQSWSISKDEFTASPKAKDGPAWHRLLVGNKGRLV